MLAELKNLNIDLEKGVFKLNGEDIDNTAKIQISYENGTWTVITEQIFSFTGKALNSSKKLNAIGIKV